jgi:D-glycero-D-manno-heptose 1,7-bisphosphate phosphatase
MTSYRQRSSLSLCDIVPAADPGERKPALLLDRDGVLNVDRGYVARYDDFEWISGAMETLIAFSKAGWHICVVTNQSGIARGYYSEQDVEGLHAEIGRAAVLAGARIDRFYYCPYHEDALAERYRIANHADRKPNPGMLLRAMRDCEADSARSIMIGDKDSDMEAGRRAGVRPFLFTSGRLDTFLIGCLERHSGASRSACR